MISQNAMELEAQVEPNEEQSSTGGRGSSRFVLWLVVFSLGVLFLPLYMISTTIQENIVPLQDELATLEAQLTNTPVPDPEEESLRAELLTANGQISALEVLQTELEANHVNWPGVMAVIGSYDPNIMRLTALQQTDIHVTLNGAAKEENAVTDYADGLRASEFFESITVQSLNLRILPTVTPMPTATPLPDDAGTPVAEPPSPSQSANREVEFTILIILRTGDDAESE